MGEQEKSLSGGDIQCRYHRKVHLGSRKKKCRMGIPERPPRISSYLKKLLLRYEATSRSLVDIPALTPLGREKGGYPKRSLLIPPWLGIKGPFDGVGGDADFQHVGLGEKGGSRRVRAPSCYRGEKGIFWGWNRWKLKGRWRSIPTTSEEKDKAIGGGPSFFPQRRGRVLIVSEAKELLICLGGGVVLP